MPHSSSLPDNQLLNFRKSFTTLKAPAIQPGMFFPFISRGMCYILSESVGVFAVISGAVNNVCGSSAEKSGQS